MAKPVIYKRNTVGRALTFSEVDESFQNLRDATISVSDGGNTITLDLNDTLNLSAGSGISFGLDAGTQTLTITSSEEQFIFQVIDTDGGTATADSTSDILTISGGTAITTSATGDTISVDLDNTAVTPGSYTLSSITVDAQGRITAASSGSVAFADLTSTPTTLSGYGITDAATSAQGALADTAVQPSDNISVLTNDAGYVTTSGIENVVEDTTPQLGGDLDNNGNRIGDPAGTEILFGATEASIFGGGLNLQSGTLTLYDGNITTDTDDLTLSTNGNVSSGQIQIGEGANGDISIQTDGTGIVDFLGSPLHHYSEDIYALGNSGSGTVTPDFANGNVQTLTATGNFTLALPSNSVSGASMTVIITQDGTGSRTMSPNASYKFAGGSSTLSTGSGDIDVLSIFYDGTNYLASLSTDFS